MAVFLAVDASTYAGSAALLRDDSTILGERLVAMRGVNEERLMPAVADLFAQTSVSPRALAGVVCGSGPGSFTSLRIAASIAKGVAVGSSVPLYAWPSLLLIPGSLTRGPDPGEYLVMLDAMRGDNYALHVSVDGSGDITPIGQTQLIAEAELYNHQTFSGLPQMGPARTIDAQPHARGVARFLFRIVNGAAVDASSWEPDYGRLAEAEVRLVRPAAVRAP